jgi:hypothetical protein
MKKFAIIIFTYNRPHHLKKCLAYLNKNPSKKNMDVFIFKDHLLDKKINQEYNEIFKFLDKKKIKIILRKKKYGLKRNIIDGISIISKKYTYLIILEDDLKLSKNFIKFMKFNLIYFKNTQIAGVSGYSFNKVSDNLNEIYLSQLTSSWGWGTWSKKWQEFIERDFEKTKKKFFNNKELIKKFNFNNSQNHTKWLKRSDEGKLQSWNIQWEYFCFVNNYLTVYPKYTFVENLGFNQGTHFAYSFNNIQKINEKFTDRLLIHKKWKKIKNIKELFVTRKVLSKNIKKNFTTRLLNKLFLLKNKINFTRS